MMPEYNREAFEVVFDRHFDDVWGYVAWRLAPDQASAQDVVQEVFLAALAGWDSYRGDGPVLSWLRAIARRKLADHFGRRGRQDRFEDMDALGQPAIAGCEDADQRTLLLAEAMRRLPAEAVELLEEKYLEGLSLREMGERHARTGAAVESALSRARELLRNTFLRLQRQQEV
jgi:RNA polymerase sigma-70 factor, ECF subfamily